MKESIGGVVDVVRGAFAARQPEEWTVELNIGFKGTASLVPVLVSGEAHAIIKVTAKWKRGDLQ